MLSDEVRAAIFARGGEVKEKGGRIHFRCPKHDDKNPSAWMAGGAWGCFACGINESIVTLAEVLGVQKISTSGYTLADYASEKAFPMPTLQSWGVQTAQYRDRDVVAIPYFGTDGKQLRRRFRDSNGGKWWEGRDLPIWPYGLERIPDLQENAPIIVVEGESDCHAAWIHGFNAIGIPGATTWKGEWANYLSGLEVYVWEEPDHAGPKFVQRLAADFPKARVIAASEVGVKDLADLHRRSRDSFNETLRSFMAKAAPLNTPKPPVVFDVLLGDRIAQLEKSKLRPIDAVQTPWPSWNHACCGAGGRHGLARGWHVIAAAKTGNGKSILALNMALSAMRAGERVCFVSLEMGQEEVETRMLAIAMNTDVSALEQGERFDPVSLRAAGKYLTELYERTGGCLYVNRQPIHKLRDVLDSIKYNHEVHGCRFFIVDYLQLAGNPLKPETIVKVSNAVRRVTVDLHVATFGLSQFNRMTSASKEAPTKEGLMGGSALENDAVQVMLIDHTTVQKQGDGVFHMKARLDKNRHGPIVEVPIEFSTRTLRMRELLEDEVSA